MNDLFNLPRPPASVAFDGTTYEPKRDHARLTGQLELVFRRMADGQWRTRLELQALVPGSEASLSARLRDLRKEQYGGHTVERRFCYLGVWEYRVLVNRSAA
jgi:hypothetical protein